MTAQQTTPVDDLRFAREQAAGFVYQTSRAAAALRSLGDVLSDEDNPIDPKNVSGLCEAMIMVGDYIEAYAVDRQGMLEIFAADRRETSQEVPQ